MRYSIGDRLVIRIGFEQSGNWLCEGMIFTILGREGSSYCCKFTERYVHDFHDLDGMCEWGYGYYVSIFNVDQCAEPLIETPNWEL